MVVMRHQGRACGGNYNGGGPREDALFRQLGRPERSLLGIATERCGVPGSPFVVQDAARADHIVLTLGTPSHVHIEIDMSDIRTVLDALLPVLRADLGMDPIPGDTL